MIFFWNFSGTCTGAGVNCFGLLTFLLFELSANISGGSTDVDDKEGCFVVCFNIYAILKYTFIGGELYVRDGMLDLVDFKISTKSIAAWYKLSSVDILEKGVIVGNNWTVSASCLLHVTGM